MNHPVSQGPFHGPPTNCGARGVAPPSCYGFAPPWALMWLRREGTASDIIALHRLPGQQQANVWAIECTVMQLAIFCSLFLITLGF